MQGGMNPAAPARLVHRSSPRHQVALPGVHVHAFNPPEFIEFVQFFDPPGDSLEAKLRR